MAYENRYNIQRNNNNPAPAEYSEESDYYEDLEGGDSPDGSEFDMEGIDGGEPVDELEDPGDFLDDGSTDQSDGPSDVTRAEILQLFKQVESGAKPADDAEKMTTQEALDVLKQALRDEAAGKEAESLDGYLKVQEVYEIDESTIFGQPPTKFENGIYTFEANEEEGSDFSLKAPGQGLVAEVKTEGSVSLTPADKDDEVTLEEEGNFYIVKMTHDGKTDTFKVDKDATLTILSDHVTGSVDNEDGKVFIGAEGSEKYVDAEKTKEIAEKIKNSVSLVGYQLHNQFYDEGMGQWAFDDAAGGGTKYKVGYLNYTTDFGSSGEWKKEAAAEVEDVKKVLDLMADAMEAKGSKEKENKWNDALDAISMMLSQNAPGTADNRGALLFNVLHGELGEKGFKEALKSGIIPQEFASKWSDLLVADAANSRDSGDELKWQNAGGESTKWTHDTKKSFLDKHSKSSSSEPPEEG